MEIIISLTSQNNFHTKNKEPTRLASGLKTFSLEFAYRNAPRHPDGCHVNRYHQYELASRAFMEPQCIPSLFRIQPFLFSSLTGHFPTFHFLFSAFRKTAAQFRSAQSPRLRARGMRPPRRCGTVRCEFSSPTPARIR